MSGVHGKEIELALANNFELQKRVRAAVARDPNLSNLFHDVISYLRNPGSQSVQPVKISSDEDDEFDASFVDEAEFIAATEAVENSKRPRDETSETDSPSKRSKSMLSPSTVLANKVLNERFGLDQYRLKQEAAITRIIDGGSTAIVFPTGGGKSLCYQVSNHKALRILPNNCRFLRWHSDIRTRRRVDKQAESRWSCRRSSP